MFRRLCLLVLIVTPTSAFAVSKEIQELQRDVAILQDLVKQLQQSQDKQLAALSTLVQQSLDAANRANTAVAVIQSNFQQNGNQLKTEVVGPVVGLSTRMDQVTNSVSSLQQAVSDLTSTLNRIQAQMSDIGNAVKVLSTPPPPPPSQTGTGGTTGGATGGTMGATTGGTTNPTDGAGGGVPPVNANELYTAARTDQLSGKLEFAIKEYQDYLKYFPTTNFAPYAQFYIGSIHYSEKNYDAAVNDFDTLLEKYPETPSITAQAHWYKGKSLYGQGKRTAAAAEFQDVIKKFPGSDTAANACNDLKEMGMNCPKPPAKPVGRRKE